MINEIFASLPALVQQVVLERAVFRLEIPINRCVHFCGFRYGPGFFNPYENYLRNLVDGVEIRLAREQFIEFLRYYRPHHMAEALGIDLSKEYPLWIYPWRYFSRRQFSAQRAWFESPNRCPDILTHFSQAGILAFRIEEEFVWLERALYSISREGYQPVRYGYAKVAQLVRSNGEKVCLMLDGNHRLSALSALKHRTMIVQLGIGDIVKEENCEHWYGVKRGFYHVQDALKIFHAYFEGQHTYQRSKESARILSTHEVLA